MKRELRGSRLGPNEVSTWGHLDRGLGAEHTKPSPQLISLHSIAARLINGIGHMRAREYPPVVTRGVTHPDWTSGGPSSWSSQGIEERTALHAPDQLAGQRN